MKVRFKWFSFNWVIFRFQFNFPGGQGWYNKFNNFFNQLGCLCRFFFHLEDQKPRCLLYIGSFFRISINQSVKWNVMFTLIQAQKPNLGQRIDDLDGGQFSQAIFFRSAAYLDIFGLYIQILGDVTVVQVCALCLFCIDIYIYYDVDIWTSCSLKIVFWTFCDVQGSAAKLNLTARALSEPAAGEMERAGENDVCHFTFHDSFSAKRKLIFQPSFFRGYVKFRGCTS